MKACGGKDTTCAPGAEDDVRLQDIGWNIGTCGATGSTVCLDPIVDCNDVASCVDCIETHAIDDAFALFYDPAVPDPGANSTLRGCLRAIGKGGASSFIGIGKRFGTCWLDVSKRNTGGSFSCPDRHALNRLSSARKAVCKACGAGKCGGPGDLPVAAIGFPTQCPRSGRARGPFRPCSTSPAASIA